MINLFKKDLTKIKNQISYEIVNEEKRNEYSKGKNIYKKLYLSVIGNDKEKFNLEKARVENEIVNIELPYLAIFAGIVIVFVGLLIEGARDILLKCLSENEPSMQPASLVVFILIFILIFISCFLFYDIIMKMVYRNKEQLLCLEALKEIEIEINGYSSKKDLEYYIKSNDKENVILGESKYKNNIKNKSADNMFVKKFDKFIALDSGREYTKEIFDRAYESYSNKLKDKDFDIELEEMMLNQKISGGSQTVDSWILMIINLILSSLVTYVLNYISNTKLNILLSFGILILLMSFVEFLMWVVLKKDDEPWARIALKALEKAKEDNKINRAKRIKEKLK